MSELNFGGQQYQKEPDVVGGQIIDTAASQEGNPEPAKVMFRNALRQAWHADGIPEAQKLENVHEIAQLALQKNVLTRSEVNQLLEEQDIASIQAAENELQESQIVAFLDELQLQIPKVLAQELPVEQFQAFIDEMVAKGVSKDRVRAVLENAGLQVVARAEQSADQPEAVQQGTTEESSFEEHFRDKKIWTRENALQIQSDIYKKHELVIGKPGIMLHRTTLRTADAIMKGGFSIAGGLTSHATANAESDFIRKHQEGDEAVVLLATPYNLTPSKREEWAVDQGMWVDGDYRLPNQYVVGYIDRETGDLTLNPDYKPL